MWIVWAVFGLIAANVAFLGILVLMALIDDWRNNR